MVQDAIKGLNINARMQMLQLPTCTTFIDTEEVGNYIQTS